MATRNLVLPEPIELDQIQGNCLGGFNKDHQAMLFLRVKDIERAKETLGNPDNILGDVKASTSQQVIRFNNQFRALRSRGVPEGTIVATWTNLVFTFAGLKKLYGDNAFPIAFRQGMRHRAAQLGDEGNSAPDQWDTVVDWATIDVLLIVASDDPMQVDPHNIQSKVSQYISLIGAETSGLEFCARSDTDATNTPFQAPGQLYGRTLRG